MFNLKGKHNLGTMGKDDKNHLYVFGRQKNKKFDPVKHKEIITQKSQKLRINLDTIIEQYEYEPSSETSSRTEFRKENIPDTL